MTLSSFWCWGSISGVLMCVEYTFITIYAQIHSNQVCYYPLFVPTMNQKDPFKNY